MQNDMKARLKYFDMMKGLAIFLVVMGHILTMCVREIDRAPVFKFIAQIHMPLFFFISGWFAVKTDENGILKTPGLVSRAVRLLLPMLGASTLFIYYYPHSGLQSPFDSSWSGLWLNVWKNGYWFTFVLFEIFAVYAALTFVLKRTASFVSDLLVCVCAWGLLRIVCLCLPPLADAALSFGLLFSFFPIFMAGVIARRHSAAFMRLCTSSTAVTVSLFVIVACMAYVCWPWRYSINGEFYVILAQIPMQIALAVVAVAVIRPWSERAFDPAREKPARFAAMWAFLGDRSLAIYLLHYFFLYPMPFMKPLLEAFDLAVVPLLVFAAIGAVPVVALSLCADYIFSFSRLLCTFITGSTPSKALRS